MSQHHSDWNLLKGEPIIDHLHPWAKGVKTLLTKTGRRFGRIAKAMYARHCNVSSLRVTWAGVLRSDCDRLIPEPSEEVRFQVANQMFLCEEGKPLVFDDSWNEGVWDQMNGYRVVFLTDLARTRKKPLRHRLQQFVLQLVRF